MMLGSIIEIVLGLLIWKIVPGWITEGSASIRQIIRLGCNIIGIIVMLAGIVSLIRCLF